MPMNTLIWKLLRKHLSAAQLAGFFIANLLGLTIILLGMQFYRDIRPAFSNRDSFLKQNYLIATKRVGTLSGLMGRDVTFSSREVEELKQQPFTRSVGSFTPSRFSVSAGMGMQGTGIHFSTEMFFEAVPDAFIDADLSQWHFDPDARTIPIIIPRNYLNLYNFGFARSRNLPKLSDGLLNLIRLRITLRGNGRTEHFAGSIVGFSNRLNTILVPQQFMDWANATLAPGQETRPSRLIIEVNNPTDTAIASYFRQKGYEVEGNSLEAGKASYFLRIVTGVVLVIGLIICLLSCYVLMLSILLLLQRNGEKLRNLLLIGYKPGQIATPYVLITAGLTLAAWGLSVGITAAARATYRSFLDDLFAMLPQGSLLPVALTGLGLSLLVLFITLNGIRKQLKRLSNVR